MDNARGVSSIQSVRNLNAQVQNLFHFQRFSDDYVLECLPLQQFHCYENLPIDFIYFMDSADVRVIQWRSSRASWRNRMTRRTRVTAG
jgi:hypothetical protein